MPLIQAIRALRLPWQLAGAALLFVLFYAIHFAVFRPTLQRYQTALGRAADLGLAYDPAQPPRGMPPRVAGLLTANSIVAPAPGSASEAGTLTAALLEDLARLTSARGMRVLATDPGATTQEAKAMRVRARVRIQCSFPELVAFLDDLDRSGSLNALERFTLLPGPAGRHTLDLTVTRYVLKRPRGPQ